MRPAPGPALGRPLVFFLLFGLHLLVFAVTPLWTFFPTAPARAVFLGGVLLSGLLWARWGAGPLRLPPARRLLPLLFFLAASLALNFAALGASIAWRGDEDHHVVFAWELAKALAKNPAWLLLPLVPILWSRFAPWRPAWVLSGAALSAALAVAAGLAVDLDMDPSDVRYHVLRYPILLKYAAAIPAWLASWLPTGLPPEWPYRLIPLASGAALAWLVFRALRRQSIALRLLAGAAVLTLPILRYYSTIFYLELPAVLGMAAVCFRADRMLRSEPDRLIGRPEWIALILLGFHKETVLPFLFAFAACRLLGRLPVLRRARAARDWRPWAGEARILFCVFLPLFLYLACRAWFGDPRPMAFSPANLVNYRLAFRFLHSLWDCFALLTPLALAGAILLLVRGRRLLLLFLVSGAGLSALLHYLDDPLYIGYSRFNLFLLPGLLALALEAVRAIGRQGRHGPPAAQAAVATVVLLNAWLTPILSDGSKRPLWGVYGLDTGEHYYPYRQALAHVRSEFAGKRVRLAGHYYPYLARFYTGDRNFPEQAVVNPPPADETARMDSLLAASAAEGYDAVLYQVLGEWKEPTLRHGYGRLKVFRNRAHALALFSR